MISNNIIINTFLLFVSLAFMLVSAVLRDENTWCIYISAGSVALLLLNTLLSNQFKITAYLICMIVALVGHFFTTSDKVTAVIFMLTILLLYEVMKQYDFSYSIIIYPFFLFVFFASVFTLPQMLQSLFMAHTNRTGLYEGVFQNANTNAAFYLMVVMCVLLFIRTNYLKKIFAAFAIICVYSTGSRNGILCLLTAFFFYKMQQTKFQKYTLHTFFGILLLATFYLIFVEATHTINFSFMGKEGNSAGRSEQIVYVINHFSVNLFGNGKDVINGAIFKWQGFAIHNFFVNSIYSSGIILMIGYLCFISDLFHNLTSKIAKAFLLAFNIYFFFEPGLCYYYSFINVVPIVIVLLQLSWERLTQIENILRENDENSTLYLEL